MPVAVLQSVGVGITGVIMKYLTFLTFIYHGRKYFPPSGKPVPLSLCKCNPKNKALQTDAQICIVVEP
jgi:hypothetical protein